MTRLDVQIEKDLTDLYYGFEVSDAEILNVKGIVKGTTFSTRGLPQHFVGNRDAETVFVMINPGTDAFLADRLFNAQTASYNRYSLGNFIDSYKCDRERVVVSRTMSPDTFDLKQAFFLKPWMDSGISFPIHFPLCQGTYSDAVEKVLNQKLQLELLPYCSKSFGTFDKNNMDYIMPYLEAIFDEISSKERKYVIFGSGKYETLFDYFNVYSARNGRTDKVSFIRRRMIIALKTKYAYCSVVTVSYYKKNFRAIIANSFPNRAYSNSFLLMQQYGKFCFDEYIKYP
jgi:hypothetical protein